MIIYKATLPNNKVYIGCTIRKLSDRIKCHKSQAKLGSKKLFHRAINKYGFQNVKWEIIFETENHQELLKKEQEYIEIYNSFTPNGYNLTKGGEGTIGFSGNKGKKRNLEHCIKLRSNHQKFGKPVVLVDCFNKKYEKYSSIGKLCRENNLNYSVVKSAIRSKSCIKGLKFILEENFNPKDPNLYFKLGSNLCKIFYITNGEKIQRIPSINYLKKLFNISERTARNLYYKNKEINGWRKHV